MEQRAQFVLDALKGHFSMTELCERYQVSRKTGYKWVERYHCEGTPGCADRPRKPKRHPNATPLYIVHGVLKARRKHPGWGARTLHRLLTRDQPETPWPSPSTIGAILKANQLVRKRRRRAAKSPWRPARTKADRPNHIWTADFKGEFRLGNGVPADHRGCAQPLPACVQGA